MNLLVQLVNDDGKLITSFDDVNMDFVATHVCIPDGKVDTPMTYFADDTTHVLTINEKHWLA